VASAFFVGLNVGAISRGVGLSDTKVDEVGFWVPVVSLVGLRVG